MRPVLILASLLFCLCIQAQNVFVINAVGFNYAPDSIDARVGDSIKFQVGPMHPTVQVSKNTWDNSGITTLPGGFEYLDGFAKFRVDQPGVIYYVCKNHVVSDNMKGVIFIKTLDTEEFSADPDPVRIYPNPASEFLSLELGPEMQLDQLRILDINGKEVLLPELSPFGGETRIYIRELKPGTYLLETEINGAWQQHRFVKK